MIGAGFRAFAANVRPGPRFPGLPPGRFGRRGGNGSKLLGRCVRCSGVDNLPLQPNHAWRHRLKKLDTSKYPDDGCVGRREIVGLTFGWSGAGRFVGVARSGSGSDPGPQAVLARDPVSQTARFMV